jgi:hypothetical protein
MKTLSTDQNKRQRSICNKKLIWLTMGGGAVFWATSVVTSLLPIAAAYRAAFSDWSIQTVWVGSLLMGMMIGCCVSYALLRFYTKIPAKGPILKAVIISAAALIIAMLLVDVPMFLQKPSAPFYYFLTGVMLNAIRFLLMGIAVGCLYKRLCGAN